MNLFEMTGEKYNKDTYFRARKLCLQIVEEIISCLQIDWTESDAQKLIKTKFSEHGIEKFWHPSKFRIASDTLKTFKDLPDQHIKIKSGDICFIDVGPIINEHEADFGRTFLINPEDFNTTEILAKNKLIEASHKVFQLSVQAWKKDKLSGLALYQLAHNNALDLGYELNLGMDGHRLGDFPHHVHTRMGLGEFEQTPITDLWVLEIHLLDRINKLGAFYEDILT